MNKNMFLKGFLPLASVILLPVSCSEDKTVPSDNDGQAIVFRVQNALPSSRAAGTTASYMDAFVINGVVNQVEAGHKSGLTLFDRTTVSRVIGSGANVFTYSPTVYYPKGATKAEFSAFSPVSSRIAASDFQPGDSSSPSDNCITYSVPSPARGSLTGDVDVAPQEDLLVAYTRKDDLSGAVVLQFKHALSRVSVKAVNLIDQPVHIHALSLHNLYTQGTLDIDGDDWGITDKADINEEYIKPVDVDGRRHTDYKTLWKTDGGEPKKALAWQLTESGIIVPVGGSPVQVTADDQVLLVLPQITQNTGNDAKVDTGDFYLEVIYTVGNITDTIQAAFNDINKLAQTNNEGLTFEMGRQYAINVSITATGLNFGLEVKNWDEPPATQFVVAFDANGGTGAATEDLLLWETGVLYDITMPNNPYHSPQGGYSFIDWSTNADATGDHYVPGEIIADISIDTMLYAQWARKPASPIITDFTYSGEAKTFTVPEDGYYQLEAWGAQGGSNVIDGGAAGAYASGVIFLKKDQNIFVYVGSCGEITGGWNGGGNGKAAFGSNKDQYGGGGATDFRLLGGEWSNAYSLNNRIMVAAGGAGSGANQVAGYYKGHAAVGLYGDNPTGNSNAVDGRQFLVSKADYWGAGVNTAIQSGFGKGGNASNYGRDGIITSAGGGSGWYGGSGGGSRWDVTHRYDAGGGSCFISGMPGCAAINPTATNTPRTQDAGTGFAKTALNFSTAVFGASLTWKNGKEVAFTNISMVDGNGYEWNTGEKAAISTGMPTNPSNSTNGNGHARITKWEKLE